MEGLGVWGAPPPVGGSGCTAGNEEEAFAAASDSAASSSAPCAGCGRVAQLGEQVHEASSDLATSSSASFRVENGSKILGGGSERDTESGEQAHGGANDRAAASGTPCDMALTVEEQLEKIFREAGCLLPDAPMAEEELEKIFREADRLLRDAPRSQGVFHRQRIEGKVAKMESLSSDERSFRKNGMLFGRPNTTEGSSFGAASRSHSDLISDLDSMLASLALNRRNVKPDGTPMVRVGELFGVPTYALTGDVSLDELSWLLADIYSSVSVLLARVQVLKVCRSGNTDQSDECFVMILMSYIRVLRSVGRRLRNIIGELGGPVLTEPIAFWTERFFRVKL